jgi:Protein of unknown function (DUF1329)
MNHLKTFFCLLIAVIATACAVTAFAAVSAEEAKQLGGPELTAFGAERAGNKEGTIPEYTGKGAKVPPNWNSKNPGQRPDPYGEKPLFSITAQNAAQYADKLDGMIELFKRYPNYRMDIYPSHRDWVFPQYVLDNTIKNATACKGIDNELKLKGCYGGLPFPIPKTGNQAMWNHLLNYLGWSVDGRSEYWLVPTSGDAVLIGRSTFQNNYPYYDPDIKSPLPADAIFYRYLGKDEAPARAVGGQFLLFDPLDPLGVGRKVYQYQPSRRWVKITADLAYDTPNPYTGGAATMDDGGVFSGALDRFDFELVGKKEKFIYNNNYQLNDLKACPNTLITSTKNFPNPDCIRWELHRVWVVKATLKPGFHHIYQKRVFYWDEDGSVGGSSENYDANGKLYRIVSNSTIPFYEAPGGFGGTPVFMDLKTGIWATGSIMSCPGCGWWPILTRISENTFSPGAMGGAR